MSTFPSIIVYSSAVVSLLTAMIVFVFYQIRQNDLALLRSSNRDLRDAIDDKSKKIDSQSRKIDSLQQQVVELQGRLDAVEAKNNEINNLVREALLLYFQQHPQSAEAIAKNV